MLQFEQADKQCVMWCIILELCGETEDPGDAFLYVKILSLLILVREYFAEASPELSKSDDALHKKARDIHTALVELRRSVSGCGLCSPYKGLWTPSHKFFFCFFVFVVNLLEVWWHVWIS